MAEKACKLLLDVDKYFTNEIVDVTKFNNSGLFTYKCPLKGKENKCINNNERINALGVHLYQKLSSIANDFKGKGDNGNRHIEIFIMWLGNKLFKIDNDYKPTLEESYKKHLMNYMGNYNYWRVIDSKKEYKISNVWYMSELYNLLNCICNIVIEYKKNSNSKEIGTISKKCHQKFTNIYKYIKYCYSYFHLLKFLKNIYDGIRNDTIQKEAARKAAIRKAAARNVAIISDTIKKANIPPQIKSSKQLLENVLNTSTVSLIDLTPSDWDQRFPNDSDNITDLHTQKCVNSYHEFVEHVEKEISKDTPAPQSKPEPRSASQKSETSPQSGTKDSGTQKGNSDSQGYGKGGANNSSGSTGDGPGNGASGGQSDQGGSVGGSKASGDQVPTHPSGKSNGDWLGNLGMSLNLTDYISSVSGIYESSKNILTNTANQITSAYNSAKAIAQDTYNKTVNIAKDAYSATTNYIGGAVNSITTQFNQFGTSQLGDNQSGSNSLGGEVDTSDQSQQKSPSPLQSLPLSPSDSQTRSDPPSPKSIDSQNSSTSIQQIAPNGGNMGSQTPPSGRGTLSISGSNPSNTKKENVITVANVKIKEAPSIWCIRPNTKCDITGISIIVISIFAFLVIMYKYLSLGWTSKSKRKKSIKKVINSIGGKRPVQIIIKSYDRNKDLKPIINSVGSKQDSLLNIYKLMQADPVPFINLFFLLIFFVYKKKINYLEL
ncbi:PIR protein CIR protein [Plasmodium vinckei vinckei]|uniref:PIR protein CIR protein n=1 Tax=Plasmodium vinckei vinckei TaxID=54757 RepID=A0A449BMS5_PLAVN|nr:PIR protein CIR protein [Plasmodium vinckei vinckei]VEV54725.1 PIR protein CIR protein [Plasmodium vinckei vinckei]